MKNGNLVKITLTADGLKKLIDLERPRQIRPIIQQNVLPRTKKINLQNYSLVFTKLLAEASHMNTWYKEAVFYQIYPLGFCGAPRLNDFVSQPVARLNKVYDWIKHIKYLGANSIYFGPILESTSHGYDTADYNLIDRRLGNNDTFAKLVRTLRQNGIKVVIDSVFNHVGRDFQGFKDVLVNGPQSKYCNWFHNLDFNQISPLNDPFNYDTWQGCMIQY